MRLVTTAFRMVVNGPVLIGPKVPQTIGAGPFLVNWGTQETLGTTKRLQFLVNLCHSALELFAQSAHADCPTAAAEVVSAAENPIIRITITIQSAIQRKAPHSTRPLIQATIG